MLNNEELTLTFRYPCYRDFKLYAGQMSAVYELIEIAVREFEDAARRAENQEEFIRASAAKFNLHVHFDNCPDLLSKVISLYIVNVHEAFERFLRSLRNEATSLVDLPWKDIDKKDDLFVAVNNVFGSQGKGRAILGEMQVELCSYYRLIRNATIHSDRDSTGLVQQFERVKAYGQEAVRQYETITTAPNPPGHLTRDDFQLFIRVAQDVAWGFSERLKPTDEQLSSHLEKVLVSFKSRWGNNAERVHTALLNYLQKTYGISRQDAVKIAALVH